MCKERIMNTIVELLGIRSVSGHTESAINYVINIFKENSIKTSCTKKGSLIATIPGESKEGILLCSHMDTLGAMVRKINDDGSLAMKIIGAFTPGSIEGEYCSVETFRGSFYTGTILYRKTSVHIYTTEGSSEKRKMEDMYIRLDENVRSRKDVEKLGISVGNYIHFDPGTIVTKTGYIKSRHLDDKVGVTVLLELASRISKSQARLPRTIHFLVTSHEEVGHGAAGYLPEDISDFIAVDMGVVGDGQQSDERKVTICAADTSGPFNYALTLELIEIAEKEKLPFAVDTFISYGSDAISALKTGLDARHALVGPGIDCSHAMERTHWEAIKATVNLLNTYITR